MTFRSAVPPVLADALRPELPALADEILGAIIADVPAYTRPLQGAFGRGIRLGVEEALRRFLLDEPGSDATSVYRGLGRGELEAGRSLDALQAAYRIVARIAWRRVAAIAAREGFETELVAQLAESIFAYIDEISAESVEGYAEAQAEQAGERQRARRRIVELLCGAHPDASAAQALAGGVAGWALPRRLSVVLLAAGEIGPLGRRLGEEALVRESSAGETVVLWPDPDGPGRGRALDDALADGPPAAIGPSVPWRDAARSLRWARRCLALYPHGICRAEDHLGELVLADDDGLLEALSRRRLGALSALTPTQRERLLETLRAWLDHAGHGPTIAARLHVHPQTVRYRVGRLRALLGDALEDPEARFDLALVLRDPRALAALSEE